MKKVITVVSIVLSMNALGAEFEKASDEYCAAAEELAREEIAQVDAEQQRVVEQYEKKVGSSGFIAKDRAADATAPITGLLNGLFGDGFKAYNPSKNARVKFEEQQDAFAKRRLALKEKHLGTLCF